MMYIQKHRLRPRPREGNSETDDSTSERCYIICLIFTCMLFVLLQTQSFRVIEILWNPGYWSPYNQENANINWCPNATCHSSPMCHPCKRKFLFVIATGRSGSTTLTNMLDLLPNIRMAGENNAHFLFMLRAMRNLEDTEDLLFESKDEVVGAWRHQPIAEQSISCSIQQMFEGINPPAPEDMFRSRKRNNEHGYDHFDDNETIVGFKTVRFHGKDFGEDLRDATDHLMNAFPCARFIINIRGDIESQVKSWGTAFGKEVEGDEIRFYNRQLEKVASYMGQARARLIDMSEWSKRDDSGVEVLNELIEWLGFRNCKYPSLLHSNKDGYGLDRTTLPLGPKCRYQGN